MTEGIIKKVFKKYHLEHVSGYYFITDKEFNDVMFRLKKELIAEIEQVFPLGYSNYSSVYIRHYLLGEKE